MKTNWTHIGVLGLFFLIVYIMIFDAKLDMNGDNCIYMSLAKNISKGLGYVSETPSGLSPVNHFPPGYSAFLSVLMFLGVHSLIFFKIVNGILLFSGLLLLFYIVSRIKGNTILAFVAVFIAILSPRVLRSSTIVMSEMSFFFSSMLVFYALYKQTQAEVDRKDFWKSPWFYVAIFAMTYSYYLRAVGAALVFSVLIFYLFRKKWIQAIVSFGGFFLLILPWTIRNHIHGLQSRYFGTIMVVNPWRPEEGTISSVEDFIKKMIENFDSTVIKGFKEILFECIPIDYAVPSTAFDILVGIILVFFVFYGMWQLKPLRWALIAYLLAQMGLFMLWHGGNGSRYVVPIGPIIIVCFYVGLYSLILFLVRKQSWTLKYFPYSFLVVVFFLFPRVKLQSAEAKLPYPPNFENYITIAKELENKLPKHTIVCCRKSEIFGYFAPNLYAVGYAFSTDHETVIKGLINDKVDYVILDQLGYSSTPRYLYPAILQYQDLFSTVWQLPNPETYLLKFNRDVALLKFNQDVAMQK